MDSNKNTEQEPMSPEVAVIAVSAALTLRETLAEFGLTMITPAEESDDE